MQTLSIPTMDQYALPYRQQKNYTLTILALAAVLVLVCGAIILMIMTPEAEPILPAASTLQEAVPTSSTPNTVLVSFPIDRITSVNFDIKPGDTVEAIFSMSVSVDENNVFSEIVPPTDEEGTAHSIIPDLLVSRINNTEIVLSAGLRDATLLLALKDSPAQMSLQLASAEPTEIDTRVRVEIPREMVNVYGLEDRVGSIVDIYLDTFIVETRDGNTPMIMLDRAGRSANESLHALLGNDTSIIEALNFTYYSQSVPFIRQAEIVDFQPAHVDENGELSRGTVTLAIPPEQLQEYSGSITPIRWTDEETDEIHIGSLLEYYIARRVKLVLDFTDPSPMALELGGAVANPDDAQVIEAMHTAGMKWVKIVIEANGEEPALPANAIQQAHENGFKVLVQVVGDHEQLTENSTYYSQFARWVGTIASYRPDAIEVWREPNLSRHWREGEISGANYTRLLQVTYDAVKAVDGNVMVISAAPAPTGAESAFPGEVVNDDNFIRQMVEAGGLQYLDCVGVEYLEGIVSPQATSGDPRDDYYTRYLPTMVEKYSQLVNAPLCFTELGYLSPEGYSALPQAFEWAQNITVENQAQWLTEAVAYLSQTERVPLAIVWQMEQFDNSSNLPEVEGYSIIRPDGSCPACDTLGNR